MFYYQGSTPTEGMRLTSTGLGIGTSSPAANLHVVGTVRSANGAGTVFSSLATDGVYAAGTDLYLLAPTGYSTIIYANNSEKFRVGTAGQIGIGGANYGTAGQVLTSGGASAAPSWATAGGGSWTYLSTVTASNAATADVETTFNSTYDMYAIVVTGLTPGNTTDGWYSRLKVGGSYQTTNYSYNQLYLKADSTTVSSRATTNGGFIPIGYANDVNSFSSFVIYVPNPSSTSVKKSTYWTGFSQYSDLMNTFMGSAMYTGSTSALTGVRIYAAGGNLTGTFRLYGIKNS